MARSTTLTSISLAGHAKPCSTVSRNASGKPVSYASTYADKSKRQDQTPSVSRLEPTGIERPDRLGSGVASMESRTITPMTHLLDRMPTGAYVNVRNNQPSFHSAGRAD